MGEILKHKLDLTIITISRRKSNIAGVLYILGELQDSDAI